MREQLKKYGHYLLLPMQLLYMEIIIRVIAGGSFFDTGLFMMAGFSLLFGVALCFLCSLYPPRVNRRVMLGVQIALAVWYLVQIIYHSFFGKFMIMYSIVAGGADQVIASGLVENTLGAVLGGWWAFLLLALPIVLSAIFGRRMEFARIKAGKGLALFGGSIVLYLGLALICLISPSLKEIETDVFNKERSVKVFGLMRSEWLDFRCNVLGLGGKGEIEAEPTIAPAEPEVKYNTMDIDFAALAQTEKDEQRSELHTYFAGQTPDPQNEYTGMFAGYNLIQITAEGFSPYAIDPELTPTLYKMQNEGFRFDAFYTPIWEVSTSDGEYTATTGLLPQSGVWSYYLSGKNKTLQPFTMPQQFLHNGAQQVRAYHNHTYSYYHRDISHGNLGFAYQGVGNGLALENPSAWPESDLEMIRSTVDDYLTGETPFMTYYMTVSGHLEYNFDGNAMARKNQELVAHLPYSDTVKAYYACNIELDRAMEYLLAALESAGVADKTVIVITPDHYPYGLEDKTEDNIYHYFDEIAQHAIEPHFELYKSCLIIYSPSMKAPVTVTKPCSSMDILPTLNNLFGFEYDSRLLMGRDILSDSEPLVLFIDRSWITDKGRYNAETGEFELFAGQSVENEQEYIERIKRAVSNKFKVSARILETDYYRQVVLREHYFSK